jgi:hypothetical protein
VNSYEGLGERAGAPVGISDVPAPAQSLPAAVTTTP